MTNRRKFSITVSLLAAGAVVQAQDAPPAPPAPPAPVATPRPVIAPASPSAVPLGAPTPMPAIAPVAPLPPEPPMHFEFAPGDFDIHIDNDFRVDIDHFQIEQQVENARLMAEQARMDAEQSRVMHYQNFDVQEQVERARAMAEEARANVRVSVDEARARARADMAFARPAVPFAFAPQQVSIGSTARVKIGGSEDSLYQRGQSALDNKRWDEAVTYFGEAAAKNGPRGDGALYWKAYALKKSGKNSEATAAIAELRKSYASSRWLDDAKALEMDMGKPVSPEDEANEELKLLALNGIMQSDPERAIPLVENQLKSSASPRIKKNALFVLAQSSNPKAQATIEQIAKGGANPDLQVRAITYITERRRANAGDLLAQIYAGTNVVQVKRAVLQAYVQNRDKDRLMAALRNEKAPELRGVAINFLGNQPGNPELWQLYASETTAEGKEQILRAMWNNGDSDKLLEVIRNEKEPKIRRLAIQVLASQKNGQNAGQLVQIYSAEQDPDIKRNIIDQLSGPQHATALISIAKAEKDPKMKLRIVERISNMASRSKEAQQYLEEILK
jgi:TolA-binding protein